MEKHVRKQSQWKKKEKKMASDTRKHASFRKGKHACNNCPGDPQTCDKCGERHVIADRRKISEESEAQSLKSEREQSVGISVSWCRCDFLCVCVCVPLWAGLRCGREGWTWEEWWGLLDGRGHQSALKLFCRLLTRGASGSAATVPSDSERRHMKARLCIWNGQSGFTRPSPCNRTKTSVHLFHDAVY